MSSQEDDRAGPSGLSHHESLQLLGLDISDSEDDTNSCVGRLICTEDHLEDTEDDLCEQALDQWEQSGGGLHPSAQVTF